MKESKLEQLTKKIIVFKEISSLSNNLGGKSDRKVEKIGKEIYERLKKKERVGEGLILNLKWSDKAANWARNIVLAIEEFKQEFPEYGKILDELIKKHRKVRRAYLEFGCVDEFPEEFYLDVIKEIVNDSEKAKKVYELIRSSDRKKKEFKYLLPE